MWLPLHLRLTGRRALVVGAGPVGRRRAAALRAAGARLRWVAPDLAADAEADEAIAAPFAAQHCDGMWLVAACAPPAVNDAVAAAARSRGALLARADAADDSDVRFPAVVRRGPVVVSLSTGAPAATAALRPLLEIPESFQVFAEVMTEARRRLAGATDRDERLRTLACGPLAGVLQSGASPPPAVIEGWIAAVAPPGVED
ncbi:MAG: bifunctional precorrin-2 dehydrogenase/sirohydrochlorin ferrochelatase [Myxococcales bacterium]|nr:bifunctional precorrin-2 dehydrogenase/sirohydrochlorin ferrochelatase [Myxococcales bacterium]